MIIYHFIIQNQLVRFETEFGELDLSNYAEKFDLEGATGVKKHFDC